MRALLGFIRRLFCDRADLVLENAVLRQQLAVYKRQRPRPKLRRLDRLFWVLAKRLWTGWREALVIVQPDTVVRWHRQGWRLYWHWKSRRRGRPPTEARIRALIRRMSRDNPTWGAPKIQAELALLGHEVSDTIVAKYMVRPPRTGPSQSWRAFLANHVGQIVACDYFVVPTLTLRLLFVLVVMAHDRRRILHVAATTRPNTTWAAGELVPLLDAYPQCRYLLHDRDENFRDLGMLLGVDELVTDAQSPWQNGHVERVIGSIRRECTNHLIPLGVRHLERILRSYVAYYNASRPHQSLGRNAPQPRWVEVEEAGPVRAVPQVGGLHHRYTRAA